MVEELAAAMNEVKRRRFVVKNVVLIDGKKAANGNGID